MTRQILTDKVNSPSALITGATGFIGGHLLTKLARIGYVLKALVRPTAILSEAVAANCEVIRGDLSDVSTLEEAVRDVDYVFHCAANVSTWDTPENYQQTNVKGVVNLCKAIKNANPSLKRLVHVSTVDVYDFHDQPADEDFELKTPRFLYGASKLLGERTVILELSSNCVSFCILRPCNVIGPGSPFVRRIGDALKNGVMLEVDRGAQNAGLLGVDTLIDCMIWAAESPDAHCEIFNVRDLENMTWHEFLVRLKAGIKGRGVLLSVPYAVASVLSNILASMHQMIMPGREPLWHPLLTEIFGKSCGHSITRLQAAGAPLGRVTLQESMVQSIDWYMRHHAS